jgi:hypothetical protein
MHSPSLSPAQGCLRLQAVYRAHRTRMFVTQRSRLEFERILAELEPEPTRPRVTFPLPFICRPQVEHPSAAAAAIAQAANANSFDTPILSFASFPSTPVASFIQTSHLSLDSSSAHAACSVPASPSSASAPLSPSAPRFNHHVCDMVEANEIVQSAAALCAVSIGVGTVEDDRPTAAVLLNIDNQRPRSRDMLKSSCDVAVQSYLVPSASATSDACVGGNVVPSSTSCDSSVHDSASYCDDSFEDDDQLAESSGSSPCSRGSCEASQLSVNIPPPPYSPEQHSLIERRWPLPLPPDRTHHFLTRVAVMHPHNASACVMTSICRPPLHQRAAAAPNLGQMLTMPPIVTASASARTAGLCIASP